MCVYLSLYIYMASATTGVCLDMNIGCRQIGNVCVSVQTTIVVIIIVNVSEAG